MDQGSTLGKLTSQLATDNFILLPERCSEKILNRILEVSRQRVSVVQEALGSREIGIGSAASFNHLKLLYTDVSDVLFQGFTVSVAKDWRV